MALDSVWNQMKQRCNNPNSEKYPLYGARGIRVEFTTYTEFKQWALSSGYAPGLSIDRIDPDGNYCASNCRWATPRQQANNLRTNVLLTAFGETKTVSEWVDDPRCSVSRAALSQRVRRSKWTPEEMVSMPAQPNGAARVRDTKTECPAGHDLSVTKVRNRRGDYHCSECSRIKSRGRDRRTKKDR